jgi:hypothetical protein
MSLFKGPNGNHIQAHRPHSALIENNPLPFRSSNAAASPSSFRGTGLKTPWPKELQASSVADRPVSFASFRVEALSIFSSHYSQWPWTAWPQGSAGRR